MATRLVFTEAEMVVDEGLGYPRAYRRICRDPHFTPYSHGPPFTFIPYVLQPQEISRARELDQLFPIIDPEAKPSTKPNIFASLLWKQLDHLGNAGFDPAAIRVDPYGNVLYYHADLASPLAWDIDHWFPCSRGGRTVPSNLRILQMQVCKKKHSKLEFLVPWWDLQLGISVNQFLSIFASSNSDFRHRAFSMLFSEGENEELNASQTVDSHAFPQHFLETKDHVGLAPGAIVLSRRESYDASSALKSLDLSRRLRSNSPATTGGRKFLLDNNDSNCKSIQSFRLSLSKENENPDTVTNPYMAIALARDSLKQREETEKMKAEIKKLDNELDEMKQKNEEEKIALQDLELVLIKRRRRVEKCRRLAEAQSSYRSTLEKMIRDAMHQSVVYKEQVRLNQAAAHALMARLEAQKAICDSAEKDLHRKFKQRDEIERQIRPQWEQAKKRSRMDDTLFEERNDKTVLYLPGIRPRKPLQKELRMFLEEEHKASEAGLSLNEERKQEEIEEKSEKPGKQNIERDPEEERDSSLVVVVGDETPVEDKLQKLEINEVKEKGEHTQCSYIRSPEREEDEECRKQRGKGNVEKWLQMLLDNAHEGLSMDLNVMNPKKEIKVLTFPESENKVGDEQVHKEIETQTDQDFKKKNKGIIEMERTKILPERSNTSEFGSVGKGVGSSKRFEGKERRERNGKERGLVRCESARAFRSIPSSPSVILGMKKGVDCIGKKPVVIGDDDDNGNDDRVTTGNNFIKSSINTFKKAVKI